MNRRFLRQTKFVRSNKKKLLLKRKRGGQLHPFPPRWNVLPESGSLRPLRMRTTRLLRSRSTRSRPSPTTQSLTFRLASHGPRAVALCLSILAGASFLMYRDYKVRRFWADLQQRSQPEHVETLRNRDCVVFFESTVDPNGALSFSRRVNTITSLEDHGYTPLLRRVHHPNEIASYVHRLRQRRNRIASLVIVAHGSPTSMQFRDAPLLPEHLAGLVKDKGILVLYSCDTGSEARKGSPSFARAVSYLNPDATVIAADGSIMANTLQSFVEFGFASARRIDNTGAVEPQGSSWLGNVSESLLSSRSNAAVEAREQLVPEIHFRGPFGWREVTKCFRGGFDVPCPHT